MVTDQLIDYIRQQTQQGVAPENIKAILRANGWENTDIEQAMKSLSMSNFAATPISPIYVNLPMKPSAKDKYENNKVVRKQKTPWLFNTTAVLVAVAGTIFALNIAFPTNINAPTVQQQSNLGPKGVYLEIRKEFDQTKNFNEFQALAIKYGSKKQVAQIEASKPQIEKQSGEFLQNLFEQAKVGSPTSDEIVSIEENIDGNTANLRIITSRSGFTGTVIMVKENGLWKLESETWSGYVQNN